MAPKPQRRSIRFAIVAVVCLLLGAVTTVGVAWWLALPTPPRFALDTRLDLWLDQTEVWGTTSDVRTSGIRRLRQSRAVLQSNGTGNLQHRDTLWAGWPALALQSLRGPARPPGSDIREDWRLVSWREGLALPWSLDGEERGLPILPLFPGFALDTAVYAAAWYLVIFTPLPLMRAGRRPFRVSRGMCGSCGYDLKGSKGGPCPECGA